MPFKSKETTDKMPDISEEDSLKELEQLKSKSSNPFDVDANSSNDNTGENNKTGVAFLSSIFKFDLERTQPGKFEDVSKSASDTLRIADLFDGLQVEYTRPITPNFFCAYQVILGSKQVGEQFFFCPNYISGNTLLSARLDSDYNVVGRWNQQWTNNFGTQCQAQVLARGQGQALTVETDYKGSDYTLHGIWISQGNALRLSYMQSITKQIAAGIEATYLHAQGKTNITTVGRYEDDERAFTGYYAFQNKHAIFTYTHKLSKSIKVATELQLAKNPQDPSWAGWQSIMNFGYSYAFPASSVRGQIDSNGKIASVFEQGINEAMKFTICSEIDYPKKSYRFGFGLSVQA